MVGVTAAGYAAIVSAAAAAGGVAQGMEGARAAKSGRKRQGEAQDAAQAAATSQQRENQIDQNRANRKKPNIAAILAGARKPGGGVDSTQLSGLGGVPGSSLSLGNVGRFG